MKLVDEQVKKQRTRRVKVGTGKLGPRYETHEVPGPVPQVALVALDPHTGEVLALVGGRNYGFSQLDHAVAKRPTGSIFKPFVYAAAVNTALTGSPDKAFTPATLIDDSPTTFAYGDQIYEPRNYKNEYHGQVTARYRPGAVAEQRHGKAGRDGRLQQRGGTGAGGRHRFSEGDPGHGAGGLRRDAA